MLDKPHKATPADKRRKRALMIFQILIYGYLLTMFLVQLHMYSNRDW